MTSAIKLARRARQAQNIPSDNITDEKTGNIILNPEVFNDDGTRKETTPE